MIRKRWAVVFVPTESWANYKTTVLRQFWFKGSAERHCRRMAAMFPCPSFEYWRYEVRRLP